MSLEAITDPTLLTIFAYAPAGFGHLRVTNALIDGIPKEARHPLILGSHDPVLEWLHRISSNNVVIRTFFEWSQYGILQDVVTSWYKWYLRMRTANVYDELLTILDQRFDRPQKILIVATHFALAHQIGHIIKRFERDKKIPIILIVQVTDDSPQHMWYVEEADRIFVPSIETKKRLESYANQKHLKRVYIEVSPYPIAPLFAKVVHRDFCTQKLHQIMPRSRWRIHVMIPISGAAAGLKYLHTLITSLHRSADRFYFHVVVKKSRFTQSFVNKLRNRPYIELHESYTYRDVVSTYEDVYIKHMIALEVTKPSEQAFKALLKPTQQGGSILLFARPIGRQEKDNLQFLRRHGLLPTTEEQQYLWNNIHNINVFDNKLGRTIHKRAGEWRGLELPHRAHDAHRFIVNCLTRGLFVRMMNCRVTDRVWGKHAQEIAPNGVELFWEKVNQLLDSQTSRE